VLNKIKKRIPRDISVMGYCGSVDSSFMSPELSTISIGYEEIGWMALRILTDADSWFNVPNRKPPEFVTPFMLKVRESTALR
jgi:DNA-binding LacI/PurR family transcriptional regulator